MKKIVSYLLSSVCLFFAFFFLIIFQPIQWVCLNFFGYQAHKKSVDILNWFLLRSTNVVGAQYSVEGLENLPKNVPLVLVCNHQSIQDIVTIMWFLRKVHPKFISKIELGKNVPSVSFNLNHGGSVLIDRKNPKQAIPQIKKVARYIEEHNRSVVIFPEGTRSRTGELKKFANTGLKILHKNSPNGYFVPLTVNNSWKLFPDGIFPLGLGAKIKLTVHKPFKTSEYDFEDIFENTKKSIENGLKHNK